MIQDLSESENKEVSGMQSMYILSSVQPVFY